MADTSIKKDIKKEGTGAEMPMGGAVTPENPLYGRLKTMHPDREFADDTERNGALDSYMSELEGYKKSGMESNSKLVSILESDPELAAVLKDMVAGSSFRGAIARHMDLSSMTPEEGEPDFEEWTNNLNERKTKKDEESAFMKSLEENNDFSQAEFKAYVEENNLSDADLKKFVVDVDKIFADANNGRIGKDVLDLMWKGLKYDKAIEEASEDAEIAGRNAKIEVGKKVKVGDGLPNVDSSNVIAEKKARTLADEWGSAADMGKKKMI